MNAPRNPLTAYLLDQVARAASDLRLASGRLAAAVLAARRFGCTWSDIGAAAGHTETWARRTARGEKP